MIKPSSLLVGALIGASAAWIGDGRPSSAARDTLGPPMQTNAVARVARDRERSVVLLHATAEPAANESPASRGWFVPPIRDVLGSGIVIDDHGLILTNAHVVESAGQIHVRRPDGEDVNTALVGADQVSDLALVRVSDATGLVPAPLGDSDQIDVGSFVVAIGGPLGLHHTVTAGVLSAKARGLDESEREFLQTDAAINPGSSGGPLFDLSGRVIGVTTVIVSGTGGSVGLNFAIPINTVKELLPALRTNSVTHRWLGIETAPLSLRGAREFGLARPDDGLLILTVEPTGPAAHGGVEPSDVLLGMAGSPPVRAPDISRRIRTIAPGTTVRLQVLRDGTRLELPIVLGTRPAQK